MKNRKNLKNLENWENLINLMNLKNWKNLQNLRNTAFSSSENKSAKKVKSKIERKWKSESPKQIYFCKTHKTGGSTLQNIIFRNFFDKKFLNFEKIFGLKTFKKDLRWRKIWQLVFQNAAWYFARAQLDFMLIARMTRRGITTLLRVITTGNGWSSRLFCLQK